MDVRNEILDAFLRSYPEADSSHIRVSLEPCEGWEVDWEKPGRSQLAPLTFLAVRREDGGFDFEEI